MAKLMNENGTLLFELILYSDPKSYEWVTYEIVIGPNKENKELLLSPAGRELCKAPPLKLSGSELYFEACYEPEVPIFCSGILDVLDEKIPLFFFEPIDQEDFQFMIKKTGWGGFVVSIYSNNFSAPGNYSRPIYSYIGAKMYAEKDDIFAFVNQLKSEYEKIISGYPEDPNCGR